MFTWSDDQDTISSYLQGNNRKRTKVYHSLPLSYAESFPILVQGYKIPILPVKPRKPQYPLWYNSRVRCEYHGGIQGHFIENCMAFKDKVQALIDANLVKFQKLIENHQRWWDWLGAICSFVLSFVNIFTFVRTFGKMNFVLTRRCAWNERTYVLNNCASFFKRWKFLKSCFQKFLNDKNLERTGDHC